MKMYTIVMDKYKNLNTTVRVTLFQQENLSDKIQFLIPPTYNGIDLSEYTVTLKYVDPNGNFHSEVLDVDTELYKDYLRYVLPITTQLTQISGTITVRLTMVKFDLNDSTTVINKLESNSTTIQIQRPTGFVDNVNFEDIEAWKAQMNQMNSDINNLQDSMPNDLKLTEDTLQLSHDGESIGTGVEILIPGDADDEDENHNGVIELDELNDPDDDLSFIELDEEDGE